MRAWIAIAAAGAALAGIAAGPATSAAPPCTPWTMKTLASGLGSLENVLPDDRGGLLVSASDQDAILRLTPDGQSKALVPNVTSPGGMRLKDGLLYFNTGDTIQAGALNETSGTIDRFDFDSGKRSTFASGLTMPNGLALLPAGDFVTSRDVGGAGSGITRVKAADPSHPEPQWADLDDTNGMAVSPDQKYLYVVETFTNESRVYRILIADPKKIDIVAELGPAAPPKGLDDMTIDGSGLLYITANGAGEVIRVDPSDGSSCVIAGGMRNTSAAKFGTGKGWAETHLFVVGFDGVVRELTPPAGQEPVALRPPTPPAAKPVLALSVAPTSIRRGRRTCVRVRVTSDGRSVREAAVKLAGRRGTTDSHGRARICVRPRRAGTLTVSASKPGAKGATQKIRVRR